MTSRPGRVSWLTEEFDPMRITRMAAQVFGVVAVVVGCLSVATTETKAGDLRGGNHNSGHHGGGHNGGGHDSGYQGGGFRPGQNRGGGFRPGYGYGGYRPGYGGWNPRVGIPPIYIPR